MYMVVGIGLNVNILREDFTYELQKTATSLLIECGKEISRPLLIASILQQLECYYMEYLQRGFECIKQEWEACSGILGRCITAQTAHGRVTGEVLHLSDRGELLIQTRHGKCAVNAPYIEMS